VAAATAFISDYLQAVSFVCPWAAIQPVEQDLYLPVSPCSFLFFKSSKMEPAQLLDIVQKMKKLEQKDIDDYLLSIQAAFYAAAKNPLKSA
jgi:hypothetical protein